MAKLDAASARAGFRFPACPIARFQQVAVGKYKLRILWDLRDGRLRYGQLRRALRQGLHQEVAPRVLSRELRLLAALGFIVRKDHRTVPPKVEYALTPLGRSALPVIASIAAWSARRFPGGKAGCRPPRQA